jgi:hypothetical protein
MKVEATGTIQQQGMTTYQYGTHILGEFTLRSSVVDLDKYIGKSVTVVGHLIKGYPIEGGPKFLEVVLIK